MREGKYRLFITDCLSGEFPSRLMARIHLNENYILGDTTYHVVNPEGTIVERGWIKMEEYGINVTPSFIFLGSEVIQRAAEMQHSAVS